MLMSVSMETLLCCFMSLCVCVVWIVHLGAVLLAVLDIEGVQRLTLARVHLLSTHRGQVKPLSWILCLCINACKGVS